MKKTVVLLVIIAVLITQCGKKEPALATVGNEIVSRSDFIMDYGEYLKLIFQKDNVLNRKKFLENEVRTIILSKIAIDSGFSRTELYRMKKDQTEVLVSVGHLKNEIIKPELEISDDDLRWGYNRSKVKLKVRFLFALRKEKADSLYQLMLAGEDMGKLARENFEDQKLREEEGQTDYFSFGDMDKDFEDTAYSLKIGEFSAPVAALNGYYIIKLLDRIEEPIGTESEFAAKRDGLVIKLKYRKAKEAFERKTKEISEEIEIEYNQPVFDSLAENLFAGNGEAGKFNDEEMLYTHNGNPVTVGDFFYKASMIYPEDRKFVKNRSKLKRFIRSLAFRDHLYNMAKERGINRLKEVEREKRKRLKAFLKGVLTDHLKKMEEGNKISFEERVEQLITDWKKRNEVKIDYELLKQIPKIGA